MLHAPEIARAAGLDFWNDVITQKEFNAPEAYLGGPIACVENGDTITIDLNTDSIDCTELQDIETATKRFNQWQQAVKGNGGIHPHAAKVENRLLKRMRATARPALQGGGM